MSIYQTDVSTRESRVAYIVALRTAGHTLKEIGDALGITRERVRQIIAMQGVSIARVSRRNVDVIVALRALRAPDVRGLRSVAKSLGMDYQGLCIELRSLGVMPALKRLFRLRTRAVIRAQLCAFAKTHGRGPSMSEWGVVTGTRGDPLLPSIATVKKYFGTVAAAFAPFGVSMPIRSVTHCKHGHEYTPENTYRYTTPRGYTNRQCRECRRGSRVAA